MDFLTNRYEFSISTHADEPEKDRPVYEFRAATIKERREETRVSKWLSDIISNPENDVDDPIEYIDAVLPLINNRLIGARVNNRQKPELMDLEDTLDYTSIVEMFMSMRLMEEIKILEKKRLRSQSNSDTVESAEVATNATESQDETAKSSNSNAQTVTETDAQSAEDPDGSI